jgi:hypothetical protein
MSDFSARLKELGRSVVERTTVDGLGENEQRARDRATLGPTEFALKYGNDAADEQVKPYQDPRMDPVYQARLKNTPRDLGEITSDSLLQFGSGVALGTAGVANLGIRAVDLPSGIARSITEGTNPFESSYAAQEAMAGISDLGAGASKALLDNESNLIKEKVAASEIRKAPKTADINAAFEKSDKKLSDHLSRIGKSFLLEGETLLSDGAVGGKVAVEATGSMIPSLLASGGASTFAKLGVKALGLEGTKRGAAAITATTAGTVGLTEGQGAYDDAVRQVRQMSEEDLAKGSEQYNALRDEGLGHEEARDRVAHMAGNKAMSIQAPIAALMGLAVSKFEGNPFSKEVAKNALRETVLQGIEEAGQSGSGQLTGNLGIQEFADKDRSASEGVGEAAAQGMWGGFNAASVISSPGLLIHGLKKSGEATAKVVTKAADIVEKQREENGPFGEKATTENIEEADTILSNLASMQEVKDEIARQKEANPDFVIDPNAETALFDALEQTKNIPLQMADTSSEEFASRTDQLKDDVVDGSRLKTLRKVAAKLASGAYDNSQEAKQQAQSFVVEESEALRSFVETTLSKPTEEVSEIERSTATIVGAVITNKLFSTGLDKASRNAIEDTQSPITTKDIINNPVGIALERIEQIDTSSFTPEGKAAIEVVKAINAPVSAELESVEKRSKSNIPERTRDQARKEILFTSRATFSGKRVVPSFNALVSIALRGAFKAVRDGNTEVLGPDGKMTDALTAFEHISNMVKSQTSKYQAGLKSLEFSMTEGNSGKDAKMPYNKLSLVNGKINETGQNTYYVNHKSDASLQTFGMVIEDANVGIRAYNALIEQFPEVYKGEKIELLTMPPEVEAAMARARVAPKKKDTADTTEQTPAKSTNEVRFYDPKGEEVEATIESKSENGTYIVKTKDGQSVLVDDETLSTRSPADPDYTLDNREGSPKLSSLTDAELASELELQLETAKSRRDQGQPALFALRNYNAIKIEQRRRAAKVKETKQDAPKTKETAKSKTDKDKKTASSVEKNVLPEKADDDNADNDVANGPAKLETPGNLKPDQLSFKDLFGAEVETTLEAALKYVGGLSNMMPTQRALFSLILESPFYKRNPKTKVRKATAQEEKEAASKNINGWWDPVAQEIVLATPAISVVLHESIHAITLEILNQALKSIKDNPSRPLSRAEQAAKNIKELHDQFLERQPATDQMAKVQKLMRDLINQDPETGLVLSINEFMAYGLTHKTVMKDLRNREYLQPTLAGRIINALKKMFGLAKTQTIFDRLFFETHILSKDAKLLDSKAAPPQTTKTTNKEADKPPAPAQPAPQTAPEAPSVETVSTPSAEPSAPATPAPQTAAPVEAVSPSVAPVANEPEAVVQKPKTAEPAKTDEDKSQAKKRELIVRYEALEKAFNALFEKPNKTTEDKKRLSDLSVAISNLDFDTYRQYKKDLGEEVLAPQVAKKSKSAAKTENSSEFIYTKAEVKVVRQPQEEEGDPIREYSVYVDDPAWIKMMDDSYNNDDDVMGNPIFDDWFSERVVDLFIGDPLKVPMLDVEWVPSNFPGGPYLHFKTALEPSNLVKDAYVNPSPDNLDLFNDNTTKAEPAKKAAPQQVAAPDPETLSAMEEELASYESELEGSREQLAKYHVPLKDILTLEEFTAVAREASSKKEQSKKIKETPEYKSAIEKIDAYEKANPNDMLLDTALDLAQEVVKDIRGVMFNIARMQSLIAAEKGEQVSTPKVTESIVGAPKTEVKAEKKTEEKPAQKKPALKEPEAPPVLETTKRSERPSYTPALTKDNAGETPALNALDLRPILAPDQDITVLLEEKAEALPYEVKEKEKAAVQQLLTVVDKMVEGMNSRLNKYMEENKYSVAKGVSKSFKEIITSFQNQPTEKDKVTVDLVYQRDRRSLVWLDNNALEEGVLQYEPHLLKLAILATIDYVMNTSNGGGLYKTEDILDALGLKGKGEQVTKEMRAIVNFGRSAMDTKEGLARHIMAFWGASRNGEVSNSFATGFVEAMADEIIDYLQSRSENIDADKQEQFWMKKAKLSLDPSDKTKTYASIRLGKQDQILGAASTIFSDILTDPDADNHAYRINEPFTDREAAVTLKKDKDILVPEETRKAVQKQEKIPFTVSRAFVDMFTFFGADTLMDIVGFIRPDTNEFMNNEHASSVDGKNASIDTSFTEVRKQLKRIEAYVKKNGLDVEALFSIPIFYRFEISSNGRYFMQGFNPQSNKFAREMFMPNKSNMDISKPGDVMLIWAAAAQALDRKDLKLEDVGLAKAAEIAEKLFSEGALRDAVNAIKNKEALGDAAHQALKTAMQDKEVESSYRLLKAIYTIAQLELAQEAGRSDLEVELVIEVDGKTNGPITAAIQNNVGQFSAEFLALVRRGGFFIGDEKISFNSYTDYKTRSNSSADLYEVVGSVWSKELKEFVQEVDEGLRTVGGKSRPENSKQAVRALIFIRDLMEELGEISFTPAKTTTDENGNVTKHPSQLTIKRKGTKGPITQNLYGAGLASIADNMVNAVMSVAYESITDAVNSGDFERAERLAKLIDNLAEINVGIEYKEGRDKGKIYAYTKAAKGKSLLALLRARNIDDLKTFRFSNDYFKRMSSAFKHLYVPTFETALQSTVGHSVKQVNDALVQATNAQTDIYVKMVKRALDELVTIQRKPIKDRTKEELAISETYIGKGNELSAADVRKVMQKYRKFAPIIDTGKTTFDLSSSTTETTTEVETRRQEALEKQAKGENAYVEPIFDSRSGTLSGTRSSSKRDTLEGAGVKILPNNTISNADVFMMTAVFNHESMQYDVLAVHDGMEVALKDLKAVSQIMNEAISDSWMTNTLEPVVQSLASMLELKEQLEQEGISEDEILNLEAQLAVLEDLSDMRQARIDALSKVSRVVEGAPGGGGPHVIKGEKSFGSETELLTFLNDEYGKALARRRAERTRNVAGNYDVHIQTEPEKGSDLRLALRKIDFKGSLRALLNILPDFIQDKGQIEVFEQTRKSKAIQAALDAGLNVVLLPVGEQSYYDGSTRTLHLGNVTAETALHEIVHAATVHQLTEHYKTLPENRLPENVDRTAAVARLESLMNDFMQRLFEKGTLERHVQDQIQAGLNKESIDGQIEALQEFMAWSLSNERMIARGKIRVANDPLSQVRAMGKKVLAAMRRLLGFTSNKVFDHVLFNAVVIMNSAGTETVSDAVFNHKVLEGGKDFTTPDMRNTELHMKISQQVTAFLEARFRNDTKQQNAARRAQRMAEYSQAEVASLDALSRAAAAGFDITETQDILLFKSIHAIFNMDLKIDKVAALELQKVFEAVSAKLSPEVFLNVLMGTTGPNATQEQELRAERMYRAAIGLPFTDSVDMLKQHVPQINKKGLSDRLALFLALAQSSPEFREVLASIDFGDLKLKKETIKSSKTLEELLSRSTDRALSAINNKVIQNNTEDYSAQNALDILTEQMLVYRDEAVFEMEHAKADFLHVLNKAGRSGLEAAGRTAGDALQAAADAAVDPNKAVISAGDKLASTVLNLTAGLADLLVDSRAKARADQITKYLNEKSFPDALVNFWAEIRGINEDNFAILKYVRAAKQQIASVRQEFVEVVPKIITAKFSDDFTKRRKGESRKQHADRMNKDWELMFRGFGQSDIAVLMDVLGESTTLNLFGDNKSKKFARSEAMRDARDRLALQAKKLGLSEDATKKIVGLYAKKSRQLGIFMTTWKAGNNLLSSARAIVGLYNEDESSLTTTEYADLQKAISNMSKKDLDSLVYSIDVIASLEAMNTLNDNDQKRLRELVVGETEGVKYALNYMKDLRKLENEKSDAVGVRINGFKGHMPSQARRKYSVIVADNSEAANLARLGYVQLRPYESAEDKVSNKASTRSYFFSAHNKLATYNQGAMQTVQDTFFGVDPMTGQTVGPETTGDMITGDEMKLLNRKMKRNPALNDTDTLIPRFNSEGVLIGFEQLLAPDIIETLQMSKNFADSLGKWSGRIKEEQAATAFNMTFVDELKKFYDEDKKNGRAGEYVAFGFERDPQTGEIMLTKDLQNNKIWAESYLLIPKAIREYGKETFGGPIMIRKDLINNSLGFRSASITDVFTGRTNMNEKLRVALLGMLEAFPVIGKDMYKYTGLAEEFLQTVVSEVKHVIVVKSGIVLVANALSNLVQLASREVPLLYTVDRTKKKYAEIAQYKKNEELKIRLRADKLAATTKSQAAAIQNRIEVIEESEKRMSIWPMIEANQFTTISEGLTDVDKALIDGKFVDWLEKKAGELPGGLSTVARYAMVSKDTALYKGMARAVQYSDFIARSVYFDFLTQERSVKPEDAIKMIDAEFINYDLVDSRARTYLESVGLTWFMNFKIRSIKIAINIAKNNPASALLALGGLGMIGLDVGSPIDDNLVSKTADGSIFYSVGPGMIGAGFDLNIWKQIFG